MVEKYNPKSGFDCWEQTVSVEDLGIPQRVVTKPASNDEDEREKIINALEATQYNKTRAAEKLNMHRSTLHEKLKKYGIDAEKWADFSKITDKAVSLKSKLT